MNTKNACHHEHCQMRGIWIFRRLLAKLYPIILLLIYSLLQIETASAQTLTLTDTDTNKIDLAQFVRIYRPGLQDPDLTAITQLDERQWRKAEPLKMSDVAQGMNRTWYKLDISNSSQSNKTLILSNISPVSAYFSAYICSKDLNNCSEIEQKHTDNNYIIHIRNNESIILLIKTFGFGASLPGLLLEDKEKYENNIYNISLYAALIDGIIISLVMYTLILWARTRQKIYFSYFLLGTTSLITVALYQKLPTSLLFFHYGENLALAAMIMPPISLIMTMQFMIIFTDSFKYQKKTNTALLGILAAVLAIIFLFIVKAPVSIVLPAYLLIQIFAYFTIYYLCITCKCHTRNTRLLLLAGASMPAGTAAITAILASGFVKSDFHSMYVTQGFTAIEMLLYSFAIMSSVKNLASQHEIQQQAALKEIAIGETLNNLLAHLNHELRTPLNGILGAAEILIHKSHPRDRHIFSMIHHTATPLKHLIDQLVNSAKNPEDNSSPTETRFDLQSLIQECMDVFIANAKKNNIRLFFSTENSVANDVTGDYEKLRQILLNLIGNACKFTKDGEVSIFVSEDKSKKDRSNLYIFEVKDTGEGVNEEKQDKLFEEFETGQSIKNPQGTGLGLSIVQKLASATGGKCGYRPNFSIGSTFWVSIPLKPHQVTVRKSHSAFDNAKILIIDESTEFCSAFINHISEKTLIANSAPSNEYALDALSTTNYDMIILQRKMASEDLLSLLNDNKFNYIIYEDNTYHDSRTHNTKVEAINRKTSIQDFSIQIAEELIKTTCISDKSPNNLSAKKLRILIAEDIIANQMIIIEMIQSLGFTTEVCSNGRQAQAIFKENQIAGSPFDAILMDCEMPIMDGFEATEKIREYEEKLFLKKTPIIALSAHTEALYRVRSHKSGMNIYLTKPVTVERILQSLIDAECL